jgi:hypothetical protein
MAAVYSVTFVDAPGLAGTAFYVIPAGQIIIVRDIDVYYVTGLAGADCQVQFQGGAVFSFASFGPGDPPSVKSWRGRQVSGALPGLQVTTSGALDVRISGYVLTAP